MIGGYELRVFRINRDAVSEVPASSKAEQDFKIKHNCEARGINVFALKWEGADHLLLATQKYPTGDCGEDAGIYGGYLVNIVNGNILRKYSDRKLKTIWPKGCPSQIWPTGLWGEDQLRQAKEDLKKSAH